MAATGTPTPNIGLRIPIGTDPASVDDINYNSNLLDTKLGAVGSDSVQDQIDTLNSKITTTSVTTIGKVKYWKSGNTVSVYVDGASASTTLTTLANLPTGYRPPTTIRARGQAGGYGNDNVQIQITDGGDVKIESSATVALSYGIVTFNAT